MILPRIAMAMTMCSTRIGLRSAMAILSAVLAVLVLAATLLPAGSVADDYHTMIICGYVYDDHGTKVAGADVTVTMYSGGNPGVSHSTTTGTMPKGFFSVTFDSGEWATGNTAQVVAQYHSGAQGVNATLTVNGADMLEWENATLPYEIPQFGSTIGLLLTAGILGVVASVVLVWRHKSK